MISWFMRVFDWVGGKFLREKLRTSSPWSHTIIDHNIIMLMLNV